MSRLKQLHAVLATTVEGGAAAEAAEAKAAGSCGEVV
jgi:hypothetical protein